MTVPKIIASGETIIIPAGRVAVLPNVTIDGTLNIEGEVFIPSGGSVNFTNGIEVNGEKLVMSVPTSYHIYNGSVEATNTVLTNGFSTTLYTGNGSTQSINTGVDMATQWGNDASETFGGLVWTKCRSIVDNSFLTDTVRGINKEINTNTVEVESTFANGIYAFNTNGFSIGTGYGTNANLATYASWNFQTTHRRTGVTNHGKAYTEHYNPYTGFTIIKYEGSGLAGHEIPHSLGRKLGFVAVKNLSSANDWISSRQSGYHLSLSTTIAETPSSIYVKSIEEEHIIVETASHTNASASQYIMYGWANSYFDEKNTLIGNYEIGVYQGTGVAGNKVTTKGKPAWLMIKRLDTVGNWRTYDNLRNNFDNVLYPNLSNAEGIVGDFDIQLDGFTCVTTNVENNASGGQYLYMVVYDNDSGSGKSKYPKATDTTNLSINALVPYANGIDVNGSKVSISYKNETITGLTYTQGKNYPYSKNDGTYGVKPYEPRMLSSELVRRYAGEQPDYYDVESNKWFNTDAGSELVSNGKFDININGWTPIATTSIAHINNTLRVNTTNTQNVSSVSTQLNLIVGKRYKIFGIVTSNLGIGTKIDILDASANTIFTSGYSTSSDKKEYDFIATSVNCTLNINIDTRASISTYGYIDNISVFASEITPTTEITESRNYLNHIVYADKNGQVTYVEELPKIEYKDVIKANEYQGKNACTAKAIFDRATYKLSGLYNIAGAINISTQATDFIFEKEMDNVDYEVSIDCSFSAFTSNAMTPYTINKTTKGFRVQHYNTAGGGSNPSMVSIIVFGGKS